MSSASVEDYHPLELQGRNYEYFYHHNKIVILSDKDIICKISLLFKEILQETDIIKNCKISKFNSKFKPSISFLEYLNRVGRCFQCSQECFVLALIYIDRITEYSSPFVVNSLNIHRFIEFQIKKFKNKF